ncbi:MAG: hypothetical protein JSV56_05985 [Methanomassiliicoccales archaeon]|nr:MAG: hypothetical protein JSV56_05985 [Methanomassiliicoccales archaeon]
MYPNKISSVFSLTYPHNLILSENITKIKNFELNSRTKLAGPYYAGVV